MARPRKWRRVCCLPLNDQFGPLDDHKGVRFDPEDLVVMSIDEYETIRLIDLESYTQEECANHMGIARTTVQGMYNTARKKIAESVVNGKRMIIRGGDYTLCSGHDKPCGCGGCAGKKCGKIPVDQIGG